MNIIEKLMWALECEMTPPPAYGLFHIILIAVGLTLCISLAWLCRRFDDKKNKILLLSFAGVPFFLWLLLRQRGGRISD